MQTADAPLPEKTIFVVLDRVKSAGVEKSQLPPDRELRKTAAEGRGFKVPRPVGEEMLRVFDSPTVEKIVPVAWPDEFVVAEVMLMVLPVPVETNATPAVPLMALLFASLKVMVTVYVELPLATTLLDGLKVSVEVFADGDPATILKVLLVAPVRPVAAAVNVYAVPDLLIEIFENVAMPLEAFGLKVPLSVPVPGLVPMARVTESVALVTVFPLAS